MKKFAAILLLTVFLSACGKEEPAEITSIAEPIPAEEQATAAPEASEPAAQPEAAPAETPAAETAPAPAETPAAETAPAPEGESVPAETPAAETAPAPEGESAPAEAPASGRADGERFEDVIVIEGMEEPVQYEHVRNQNIGIEMDYDYENFVRKSEADRERFVSAYDNPDTPENYLDVMYSADDAETVAAAITEELSSEYEVRRDSYDLGEAGTCIKLDASEVKGGGFMPEIIQAVYIIPASDGCRIARTHCYIEGSEGFGRRFSFMVKTIRVIGKQ